MAKLPFDDPDVDAHAQEVLMTAITQFYPEFVLGLGDEATTLLPSGGRRRRGLRGQDDAGRHEPHHAPDGEGIELPERLRGGTFMTAVATLQGKLLAEPSLAPFTLRAEARALARRALWWQYSAPDDLTEKQAISAARDAIQARIQREQLDRHKFTYKVILEQPADKTSLRDAYAPFVADDVPWECLEQNLVPPAASQQDALRREDLLVHIAGHADTAIALSARIRAIARSLEPAKRLCWFMSTVQYSHNAIEDVRLGVGEEGDFATFESLGPGARAGSHRRAAPPSRYARRRRTSGQRALSAATRRRGRGVCCSSSSRRRTSMLFSGRGCDACSHVRPAIRP